MSFNLKGVTLMEALKAVASLVNADPAHPEDSTYDVSILSIRRGTMVRVIVYNVPTEHETMRAQWFSDATPEESIIIARAVLMNCGHYHVDFYNDERGMLQVKPVF